MENRYYRRDCLKTKIRQAKRPQHPVKFRERVRLALIARCARGNTPRLPRQGARCALPWTLRPLAHFGIEPVCAIQPFRRLITRKETSLSSAHHRQRGISPPLGTHSRDLENSISTRTEPWTNVWPSEHQSESFHAPRHPMTRILPLDRKEWRFRSPFQSFDQPSACWIPSEPSRPEPRPKGV